MNSFVIIVETFSENQSQKQKKKKKTKRIIAIVLRFPVADTYRKLGLFMRLPECFVGTFSIP